MRKARDIRFKMNVPKLDTSIDVEIKDDVEDKKESLPPPRDSKGNVITLEDYYTDVWANTGANLITTSMSVVACCAVGATMNAYLAGNPAIDTVMNNLPYLTVATLPFTVTALTYVDWYSPRRATQLLKESNVEEEERKKLRDI